MAVYRNLQEQVFENAKDIEKLKQDTSPEEVKKLATEAVNDIGIEHFDDTLKITAANNEVWGNFAMYQREGNDWNAVFTVNPRDLRILTPYNTIVGKVEIYNPSGDMINFPLLYVDGIARIGSLDVDSNLKIGKNIIWPSHDGNTYSVKLPAKSGTLALLEDLPANTGTLKIGNTEITEEQLQRLLQLIA